MTARVALFYSVQAQIRQQMSTRAEVLDEERKKAEVSLEGLKSKLKNLEEVQGDECLISPNHISSRQMNKQSYLTGILSGCTNMILLKI